MKKTVSGLLALTLLAQPVCVMAERFEYVHPGANYYKKGIFSDTKVQVLAKDASRRRVQTRDLDTGFVEWTSADNLITPNESTERNVGRGVFAVLAGAAIVAAATDDSKPPRRAAPSQRTRRVSPPKIGVAAEPAGFFTSGLRVTRLVTGGAAARAGIQVGDRITTANGTRLSKLADLSKVVGASKGKAVRLTAYRGTKRLTLNAYPR